MALGLIVLFSYKNESKIRKRRKSIEVKKKKRCTVILDYTLCLNKYSFNYMKYYSFEITFLGNCKLILCPIKYYSLYFIDGNIPQLRGIRARVCKYTNN